MDVEKAEGRSPHFRKYSHLAAGIQIDKDPHTVHIILGENGGQWYYSHILLHIEKGRLLECIRQTNPGSPTVASLSNIKDTTLLRLLQADSSKTIDEHGEPKPVFQRPIPEEKVFPSLEEIYFVNEKKGEATEAIQTVIAQYGYTPEFSGFRKQVGAVVSSLEQSSTEFNKESSKEKTMGRDSYDSFNPEPADTYFNSDQQEKDVLGPDYLLSEKLEGFGIPGDFVRLYNNSYLRLRMDTFPLMPISQKCRNKDSH